MDTIVRKFPLSILPFLFTLVAFWLQSQKFPGELMIWIFAPFWSVFSVNFGFIVLAFDAMTNRLPRWLIALPVIYFTGYMVVATASNLEADRTQKLFAQQIEDAKFSFNPKSDVLLFETRPGADAGQGFAREIFREYDLPIVFYTEGNKSLSFSVERMPSNFPGPEYENIARDEKNHISREIIVTGRGRSERPLSGWCVVVRPEQPHKPTYRIWFERRTVENWFLGKELTIMHVRDPKGDEHELTRAVMQPLLWLPVPLVGFTPIDGRMVNKSCFMQAFGKNDMSAIDSPNFIARIFRLRKAEIAERCAKK